MNENAPRAVAAPVPTPFPSPEMTAIDLETIGGIPGRVSEAKSEVGNLWCNPGKFDARRGTELAVLLSS